MITTQLKLCVGMLLAGAGVLMAQTALKFEVASIKPAVGTTHIDSTIDGARVDLGFYSLGSLVAMAYRQDFSRISGPEWIKTERFDVVAKIPEGAGKPHVPEMLQSLLADRFKLVVRHEPKEQSIYALVVAKDGLLMKESPPEGRPPTPFDAKSGIPLIMMPSPNGMQRVLSRNGEAYLEAERMDMAELATFLGRYLELPVLNSTELKSLYQVSMRVPPKALGARGGRRGGDGADQSAEASDPSGVSVIATVQKLGLRLEKRKATLDYLIIEHAEKVPTEN